MGWLASSTKFVPIWCKANSSGVHQKPCDCVWPAYARCILWQSWSCTCVLACFQHFHQHTCRLHKSARSRVESGMKLESFRQLWGADVLHIKFMRPRQDVYANCEVMRHTIQGGDAEATIWQCDDMMQGRSYCAPQSRSVRQMTHLSEKQHCCIHLSRALSRIWKCTWLTKSTLICLSCKACVQCR